MFGVHSPTEGAGCHQRPSHRSRALVATCTLLRELNPKYVVRSLACRTAAALLMKAGDYRVTSEALTLSGGCIGGEVLMVKHVTVNIYKLHELTFSGASRAGARTRVVATDAIFDGHQPRVGRMSTMRMVYKGPPGTKIAVHSVRR